MIKYSGVLLWLWVCWVVWVVWVWVWWWWSWWCVVSCSWARVWWCDECSSAWSWLWWVSWCWWDPWSSNKCGIVCRNDSANKHPAEYATNSPRRRGEKVDCFNRPSERGIMTMSGIELISSVVINAWYWGVVMLRYASMSIGGEGSFSKAGITRQAFSENNPLTRLIKWSYCCNCKNSRVQIFNFMVYPKLETNPGNSNVELVKRMFDFRRGKKLQSLGAEMRANNRFKSWKQFKREWILGWFKGSNRSNDEIGLLLFWRWLKKQAKRKRRPWQDIRANQAHTLASPIATSSNLFSLLSAHYPFPTLIQPTIKQYTRTHFWTQGDTRSKIKTINLYFSLRERERGRDWLYTNRMDYYPTRAMRDEVKKKSEKLIASRDHHQQGSITMERWKRVVLRVVRLCRLRVQLVEVCCGCCWEAGTNWSQRMERDLIQQQQQAWCPYGMDLDLQQQCNQ